jgi:hypothetical protein
MNRGDIFIKTGFLSDTAFYIRMSIDGHPNFYSTIIEIRGERLTGFIRGADVFVANLGKELGEAVHNKFGGQRITDSFLVEISDFADRWLYVC